MRRRIGLVVGDTPGHFYPALAVAQAYQRRVDADIVFFGPPHEYATTLAARHGCRFQTVSSSALARAGVARRVAATARTFLGIVGARRLLARAQIRLVIAFGGFASGAVILAARGLGCGSAIHEANVIPGMTNRLLGQAADRVYVSAWTQREAFAAERVIVTGWPVRDDVNALARLDREPPQARTARVLVCSGSRGGAFFAREIPDMAARLVSAGIAVSVRHQAGDAEVPALRDTYERRDVRADISRFIDDMPAAYRWADVIVARSGAGTIAEIALAGLPSLLVPLADAAEDHQTFNARAYAGTGAAVWTGEPEWRSETMASRMASILEPGAWSAASGAARRFATPSAADDVVVACEHLMEGRW